MIKTLSQSEFIDETNKFEQHKNNFSYEAKQALFNYLEEYEESTGEKIEFDYIALCCEYTEYENLKEYQEQYGNEYTKEEIQDRTQYIPIYDFDGKEKENFIIQNY